MQFFTLGDLLTRLNQELDLTSSDPVTRNEKISYINQGIREAAAAIHKLGVEDQYFRASQPLNLNTGQSAYGLPTNIYGNKILKIMYKNGTDIYEIKRLRHRNNMSVEMQIAYIQEFGSAERYSYLIINDSAAFGNELTLYPTSRETSTTRATIWYVRLPNVVSQDDDIVDIPEFADFVLQFAKVKCLRKEFLGEAPEGEIEELERQRTLMVDTLAEMVPDENNLVDQDSSFYSDFDRWDRGDY